MIYRIIAFSILTIAYFMCLLGRINQNTSISKLSKLEDARDCREQEEREIPSKEQTVNCPESKKRIESKQTNYERTDAEQITNKMLGKFILNFELFGIADNDKKALTLKFLISFSFVLVIICEIISIIYGDAILGFTGRGILLKVFGTYFGIVADCIFIAWNFEKIKYYRKWKKDNKAEHFITTGVYRYSRYPGALGMMLLCLSILFMYFNYYLLVASITFLVLLHIFFCYKDKKLRENEGEAYEEYRKYTHMYYGRGKWNIRKIKLTIYLILFAFSILYFGTCVLYAGIRLSGVWIWPAFALFALARMIMLLKFAPVGKRGKISLKIISIVYHVVMFIAIVVFAITEFSIIKAMNTVPDNGLDYVIVLGAGLNGEKPTRPLQLRIERAYRYLISSSDTTAIASGGQGSDEVISEAQAIKNELVALGIEPERIILEDRSTSTEENIKYSFEIIGDDACSVGIVTNSFHVYRARMLAKLQGHDGVVGVPAQTLFPVGIHYVVREAIGVLLTNFKNLQISVPMD